MIADALITQPHPARRFEPHRGSPGALRRSHPQDSSPKLSRLMIEQRGAPRAAQRSSLNRKSIIEPVPPLRGTSTRVSGMRVIRPSSRPQRPKRSDFCEAADPESKGAVEALIRYAKSDLVVRRRRTSPAT
jgi:hypothetical protein